MVDSLNRLYAAVAEARDRKRGHSRTAKLFRDGRPKMAKKLVEEATEVAVEAVLDRKAALIRESADLLYNLAVLWAELGVRPADVWAEMDRRERALGIAEKLPKKPLPARASGTAANGKTRRRA